MLNTFSCFVILVFILIVIAFSLLFASPFLLVVQIRFGSDLGCETHAVSAECRGGVRGEPPSFASSPSWRGLCEDGGFAPFTF